MTAKEAILARLREVGEPVPVHSLNIVGVSENSAATRLSELARAGKVVGVSVPGKAYKAWKLSQSDIAREVEDIGSDEDALWERLKHGE